MPAPKSTCDHDGRERDLNPTVSPILCSNHYSTLKSMILKGRRPLPLNVALLQEFAKLPSKETLTLHFGMTEESNVMPFVSHPPSLQVRLG